MDSNTNYSYLTFVKAYDTVYLSGEQQFKTLVFDKQGKVFAIRTKEDLSLLSYFVNNSTNSSDYNAYLTAQYVHDINTTNNITSIGSIVRPFSSRFDGNNHIIYNVNIERLQDSCQGLFGYTRNAGIYNLGIANINVVSKKYTGGMVSFAENTYIKNCYVQGGNLYATSYSGGLIGYLTAGDSSFISGCYNTFTVEGNNYIGVLLGYNYNGVVQNSYAAHIIGHGNVGIGAIIGGTIDVLTYNFYFSMLINGHTNSIGIFDGIGSKHHNTKAGRGLADTTVRSDAFVNMLNTNMSVAAWRHDYDIPINDGSPILVLQDGVNLTVSTLLAEDVTSNSAKLRGCIEVEGEHAESKDFMWKQSSDSSWHSVNVLAEDFEYVVPTDLKSSV